ncbi:MAG: type II 3-dehydroquinate dehydratase [Dehalococcoidia bacterium]|nr:type II 3-dehydroquinate dehydratase [Dehalococcoidia bacterium]
MSILVINGPNLNNLGTRDPEIYGNTTLREIEDLMTQYGDVRGLTLEFFQSNHEGSIVDLLQEKGPSSQGIIINPAAFTHTSVALRDALSQIEIPVIEVHISNIHAREEFRRISYISGVATGQIVGLGTQGYLLALDYLADLFEKGGAND